MRAINIGGLHRSGTTLAQFMVGAHPDCIAMGEVPVHLSGRRLETNCSCGHIAIECPFWHGITTYDAYRERLQEMYPGKRPVTSNKLGSADLSMVRDVRGWARSVDDMSLKGYLRWYRRNKHRQNVVSYERLVFDPERVLGEMCQILGLRPEIDAMLDYDQAEHHAVRINRMAGDPAKMGRIVYDKSWMADSPIPAALLPWVMNLNARLVHPVVVDAGLPCRIHPTPPPAPVSGREVDDD